MSSREVSLQAQTQQRMAVGEPVWKFGLSLQISQAMVVALQLQSRQRLQVVEIEVVENTSFHATPECVGVLEEAWQRDRVEGAPDFPREHRLISFRVRGDDD